MPQWRAIAVSEVRGMIWAGNSRTLSSGDGREVPAMLRVGGPVGFTVAHTRDAQIPALRGSLL